MYFLQSLRLKAFRSFVEEVEIKLGSTGLYLIDGKNHQTQDASGTGKSSLFYATAFALNILPTGINAKDLQSFLTKEKMQVVLRLSSTDLGDIVISRGKETFIEYSGNHFEGATLVNEHLVRVFGLTSEMLATMVFRPQNSGGHILSKNSTELVEFLSTLLGLNLIEKAIETSNEIVKTLSKEILSLDGQIQSKTEVVNSIDIKDVSALEADNQELSKQLIQLEAERVELEVQIDEIGALERQEEAAIKVKYEGLKSQAKTFIASLETQDEQAKKQVAARNISIKAELNSIGSDIFNVKTAKTEIVSLEKERQKLVEAVCPTCDRSWEESKTALALVVAKIEQKKNLINQEPELIKKKETLEAQLQVWEPNPQIQELKMAIKNFDIQAMSERVIGRASGKMNVVSSTMREIAKISERYNTNKVAIEQQKEVKRLLDQTNKDLATLKDLRLKKQGTVQTETDFCKVLGKEGFLGSIFDEVLQEVVQTINGNLSNIANMAHVTFNFRTEALNTKGVVKKSIVPMVSILGHESKISALSGGMLTSLELISDLAVKEVMERRTGKKIGFYFADEVFNGQGRPSQEACFEVLKQNSTNRAVFVIDHRNETKELFTQIINVEMENGISSIK